MSEAYQTLSDKKLRSDYDLKSSGGSGSSSAGPGARAGAASQWNPKTGRYEYRRPEDRFQYSYKAAGDSYRNYGDRKFNDQQTQQQRSEQWSRVYEELNKQRHKEYEEAARKKHADYSDFMNGRKSDRSYRHWQSYYGNHDDTKNDGKFAGFARGEFENKRFGTEARFHWRVLRGWEVRSRSP